MNADPWVAATRTIVALLLFQNALIGGAIAHDAESISDSKKMISSSGVEYLINLSDDRSTLMLSAHNPTNRTVTTGVTVIVDQREASNFDFSLRPGGNWSTSVALKSTLNQFKDVHSVKASTYGNTKTFQFQFDAQTKKPTGIPIPYISEVNVGEGQIESHQSTLVNVTVVNPSNQLYPTKLMVHTEATDGSFYAAIVPPGESETVTVELLDSPDSVVVGEARLYVDQFNESENGVDQVGFKGTVDGDTPMWNESYVAVEGPWSDHPYRYENDSVGRESLAERVSGERDVEGVPIAYPVVALAAILLLVGVVVRRR